MKIVQFGRTCAAVFRCIWELRFFSPHRRVSPFSMSSLSGFIGLYRDLSDLKKIFPDSYPAFLNLWAVILVQDSRLFFDLSDSWGLFDKRK